MRLPHEYMNCVAYLYPEESAAELGDSAGAATAFWVSHELSDEISPGKGRVATFLVTNRHVIDGGVSTLRYARNDGNVSIRIIDTNEWIFHQSDDVDLAIWEAPADLDAKHFPINFNMMVKPKDVSALDVRLGDDVFMIGRHLGYDGKLSNTPTTRFGHLVQFPLDKILDERGRSHEAFLIQIPSLPGFSGSPVFLGQDQIQINAENHAVVLGQQPRRIRLLEVNLGHLPHRVPTVRADNLEENAYLNALVSSGINVVVPAWDLAQMILQHLIGKIIAEAQPEIRGI